MVRPGPGEDRDRVGSCRGRHVRGSRACYIFVTILTFLRRSYTICCARSDALEGDTMFEIRIVLRPPGWRCSLSLSRPFRRAPRRRATGRRLRERLPRASQGTVTGASGPNWTRFDETWPKKSSFPTTPGGGRHLRRRFEAPGWKKGATDGLAHGGSYAASAAGAGDARFKLKVPTSGDYAVYAWWPYRKANSTAARFGVRTSSGTKWTKVDQTKDGGYWVQIGTYHMEAGDYYAVSVSAGKGSGALWPTPWRSSGASPPASRRPCPGRRRTGKRRGKAGHRRRYLQRLEAQGPRQGSAPDPARQMAHRHPLPSLASRLLLGVQDGRLLLLHQDRPQALQVDARLPGPAVPIRAQGQVEVRPQARGPGLLQGTWPPTPITHVGMFSGNGHILHASAYFNRVVNSEMKYIRGYYGARRIRPPR